MTRQFYDDATRLRALAIARASNAGEAERATGVPSATIRSWIKRGVDPGEIEVGEALVLEQKVGALEDHELGRLHRQTADAMATALRKGDSLAAQRLATPLGVLEDKLQRRAETTGRPGDGSLEDRVAHVVAMRGELAIRQVRREGVDPADPEGALEDDSGAMTTEGWIALQRVTTARYRQALETGQALDSERFARALASIDARIGELRNPTSRTPLEDLTSRADAIWEGLQGNADHARERLAKIIEVRELRRLADYSRMTADDLAIEATRYTDRIGKLQRGRRLVVEEQGRRRRGESSLFADLGDIPEPWGPPTEPERSVAWKAPTIAPVPRSISMQSWEPESLPPWQENGLDGPVSVAGSPSYDSDEHLRIAAREIALRAEREREAMEAAESEDVGEPESEVAVLAVHRRRRYAPVVRVQGGKVLTHDHMGLRPQDMQPPEPS